MYRRLFVSFYIITIAANTEVPQLVVVFIVGYNTNPVTKTVLFQITFRQILQVRLWEGTLELTTTLLFWHSSATLLPKLLTFPFTLMCSVKYFSCKCNETKHNISYKLYLISILIHEQIFKLYLQNQQHSWFHLRQHLCSQWRSSTEFSLFSFSECFCQAICFRQQPELISVSKEKGAIRSIWINWFVALFARDNRSNWGYVQLRCIL